MNITIHEIILYLLVLPQTYLYVRHRIWRFKNRYKFNDINEDMKKWRENKEEYYKELHEARVTELRNLIQEELNKRNT